MTGIVPGYTPQAVMPLHTYEEGWSPTLVERLKSKSFEIEASSELNPHGFIMQRGHNGVPWPYTHRNVPINLDWNWWRQLLTSRFRMTDNGDNEDTPITSFIELLVEWYKTGGNSPTFGFGWDFPSYGRTPKNPGPMRAGFVETDRENEDAAWVEGWRANAARLDYPLTADADSDINANAEETSDMIAQEQQTSN